MSVPAPVEVELEPPEEDGLTTATPVSPPVAGIESAGDVGEFGSDGWEGEAPGNELLALSELPDVFEVLDVLEAVFAPVPSPGPLDDDPCVLADEIRSMSEAGAELVVEVLLAGGT